MAQFDDDCRQGLWTWLPLTTALAAKTTAAFARLPRQVFLRAADALHVICAQEHGLPEIYTNDRHLSAAARHFRLKPMTVAPRSRQPRVTWADTASQRPPRRAHTSV